jgi:hypothetical protein
MFSGAALNASTMKSKDELTAGRFRRITSMKTGGQPAFSLLMTWKLAAGITR